MGAEEGENLTRSSIPFFALCARVRALSNGTKKENVGGQAKSFLSFYMVEKSLLQNNGGNQHEYHETTVAGTRH